MLTEVGGAWPTFILIPFAIQYSRNLLSFENTKTQQEACISISFLSHISKSSEQEIYDEA